MAIGDAEVTRNEHITVEFFIPYQCFHSPIVASLLYGILDKQSSFHIEFILNSQVMFSLLSQSSLKFLLNLKHCVVLRE